MKAWPALILLSLLLSGCEFLSQINTTQYEPMTRGVVDGVPIGGRRLSSLQQYGIILADSRDGTHIILPADKLFAETTDRVIINPDFQGPLNELVHVLKGYPTINISIVGHTDGVMPADLAEKKSSQYAYAVSNYLTSAGLSPTRISSVRGAGSRQPIDRDRGPQARATNRRVEVITEQPIK